MRCAKYLDAYELLLFFTKEHHVLIKHYHLGLIFMNYACHTAPSDLFQWKEDTVLWKDIEGSAMGQTILLPKEIKMESFLNAWLYKPLLYLVL